MTPESSSVEYGGEAQATGIIAMKEHQYQHPRHEQQIYQRRQMEAVQGTQGLDASSTLSAGLYGARRLPERKDLWRAMVADGLDDHDRKEAIRGAQQLQGTRQLHASKRSY